MARMRKSKNKREDPVSLIWQDFLLTLTFIFMLLIGGMNALAPAATPNASPSSFSPETIQLYVGEGDGALYYGSFNTPPVSIGEVVERVKNAVIGYKTGTELPIIIHHTPSTPSLFVFNTLSALGKIPGTKAMLALSEYTTP